MSAPMVTQDWTFNYGTWRFGLREWKWPMAPSEFTVIHIGPFGKSVDEPITTVAWYCAGAFLISAVLLAFTFARFIHKPQADRGDG